MSRLAALLAQLRRHHPGLQQRKADATARTGHWPITDQDLADVLTAWTQDEQQRREDT